jgi:hypothetical protein
VRVLLAWPNPDTSAPASDYSPLSHMIQEEQIIRSLEERAR